MRFNLNSEITFNLTQEFNVALKEAHMDDCLDLYINSFGGSVYEGYTILSSIAGSKLEFHSYIEGYAASMAAIIAIAADKVCMASHSLLMFHKPFIPGEDAQTEFLQKTAQSLITLASKKVDPELIKSLMDQEKWLTAQEALDLGIIDEIYDMGKDMPSIESGMDIYQVINCFNSMENINQVSDSMDTQEVIEEVIETSEDLSEKLREFELRLELLTTKLSEKEDILVEQADQIRKQAAELEDYRKKEYQSRMQFAENTVKSAVEAGKIAANASKFWVKSLIDNTETALNMLNSIQLTVKESPINLTAHQLTVSASDPRNSWTIRDWEKQDPTGLSSMMKNEPARYKELFRNYYGVDCN